MKEVTDFLQSTDTYTKHKGVKLKFSRRMVTSPKINNLWQGDLIILDKLSGSNNGFKYLLTLIDVLSRYAYIIPIKKKNGETLAKSFDDLFKKNKCKYLQVDFGTEFYNQNVKKVMKKHNVTMFSTYSNLKASVVERFNKTIMNKIQKYLNHNGTKRYIDQLDNILKSYNYTVHSRIGIAPVSVNELNQLQVWHKSFEPLHAVKKEKNLLKKNDYVRIKINKNVFEKGYKPTFSNSIYYISDVLNTVPVMYKLSDSNGQVLGSFYKNELSKLKNL